MENLKEAIAQLKREKNAVVLGHYYQRDEIQEIADFVGDSLALAQWAARTEVDIIVMCGVHFMGETAKILCPDKKVLVPDSLAGCSLADSCPADRRPVCTIHQRTSGAYGDILRQHHGSRQGADRRGGDLDQRQADCGKLPQR